MSECKHRKPNGVCVIETEVVYRGYCIDGPCSCFEPLTNSDRIRSMTDEELADFLYENRCMGYQAWLDWLKQEVTTNSKT